MTDSNPSGRRRTELAESLAASGQVTDSKWLEAFRDIPRDLFVPHFFTQSDEGAGWRLVESNSRDWLDGVHGTGPLITQLDGDDTLVERARTGEPVSGTATSSSSAPTLMAVMLQALDVSDGTQVLEIGTGTGYNTAVLCHRLGSERVTSVDVDPGLIHRVHARLTVLDYTPQLYARDGRQGCPEHAPYDRIIATVGITAVPGVWIDQTRSGGMILVPLDLRNRGGLLARLTVRDGIASGPFLPDYGGFMATRHERHDVAQQALRLLSPKQGSSRTTDLPASVATDTNEFKFFAALRTGGYDQIDFTPSDGAPTETWLAREDGSWACHTSANGRHTVHQGGPSRLWDEIEAAYDEWSYLGRPTRDGFGLRVDRDGSHTVWFGDTESQSTWRLTT